MIDCDPGVDDALALILAFRSPELEVKTVTGVNGNVPVDRVFDNIQNILALLRPQSEPMIAKGADRPLKGEAIYAYSVHGEDGLGGVKIERKRGQEAWQTFKGRAAELIADTARQYPNEMTLVATGPLTNLALAVQEDLEGMKRLKEVVVMGGAVRTKGNITPHAEFNVFVDPWAAKIVFKSGLPITLVPLDVTHQVFLTAHLIEERVKPIQGPLSRLVVEATGYDSSSGEFRTGEVFFLHDPLAVGVTIHPGLVKKERLSIHVETGEGDAYGQTSEASKGPTLEVCTSVDAEGFLNLFLSRLR